VLRDYILLLLVPLNWITVFLSESFSNTLGRVVSVSLAVSFRSAHFRGERAPVVFWVRPPRTLPLFPGLSEMASGGIDRLKVSFLLPCVLLVLKPTF